MPSELETIDAAIAEKQADLVSLNEEKNAILAKITIQCVRNNHGPGCEKTFPIKDIVFLQTHWYVEPYSCSGGDYWKTGEGNWVCPNCNHRNRLVDCWTPGSEEIAKLKHLFLEVEDEYDK